MLDQAKPVSLHGCIYMQLVPFSSGLPGDTVENNAMPQYHTLCLEVNKVEECTAVTLGL